MKFKFDMRTSHLVFMLIFMVSCVQKKPLQDEEKSQRPNVVFIFTDDLGYGDIGAFGATDIKTPNIDRLAKEGIQFTNFYSASSVCSPSRAGLLTGRLPQRFGLNAVLFPESHTGMPNEEYTMAEMFQSAGYRTGMVGKWHLGHQHQYMPLQQGFEYYFGIPYSNDMASLAYFRGNKVVDHYPDQRLMTKKLTNEALQYIEEQGNGPFFLYVAHPMPHVPIYASDEFIGTSDRGLYGDVVQEIDWSVGEILSKLEQQGILENTLVVFSSDNGPWLPMGRFGGSAGELRSGKFFTFEGGMRVPTVAMWKGQIPEGKVYDGIASQMDWMPTFARLAGADLNDSLLLDGIDIGSVLRGEKKVIDRDYLFIDNGELQAYRNKNWKVKLPYEGWGGTWYKNAEAAHDTLLFDLDKDPGETTNLYESNKEFAHQLLVKMNLKYDSMKPFPDPIVNRTDADLSHLTELRGN